MRMIPKLHVSYQLLYTQRFLNERNSYLGLVVDENDS